MVNDPIKHVIVLMLENHSFDQMLGGLRGDLPRLEGVDPANPGVNRDSAGTVYVQRPVDAAAVSPDPIHETANVLRQLDGNNGNFVADYASAYPATTVAERQQVMGYFRSGSLSALHFLARNFAVCDHWYSSVPGPTWANRFFVHSGTSIGRVIMPSGIAGIGQFFGYNQDTIYDRFNEKGIKWRIYYGDIPQSLVLTHQRHVKNAWRYYRMAAFFSDVQKNEAEFPEFCFIEPKYYPPGQDDDHPPHSPLLAQNLITEVYNALRQNDGLWKSSLLVILYDEHGGFYDHVSPPAAVPPDQHHEEYTFDRLGVRVPAVLVSPWIDQQIVTDVFDHTSLLKYVTEKWGLSRLTNRVDSAKSIANVIRTTGRPREVVPAQMPPVAPAALKLVAAFGPVAEQPGLPLNEHQRSLVNFTDELEKEITDPVGKPLRAAAMAMGPTSQTATAINRVEEFLHQRKASAPHSTK